MSLRSDIAKLQRELSQLKADAAAQSQRPADIFAPRDEIMGRVVGRVTTCDCDTAENCETEVWDVEFLNVEKDDSSCSVTDVSVTRRNTTFTREAMAPPQVDFRSTQNPLREWENEGGEPKPEAQTQEAKVPTESMVEVATAARPSVLNDSDPAEEDDAPQDADYESPALRRRRRPRFFE